MNSLRKRGIIIFSILSLVMVACGGAAEEEVVEETTPEVVESLDSPAVTTASAIKTGTGVTEDPCPAEIGGVPTGANPAQGCIYLGMLNDYTGPFAPAGPGLEIAQRAFWLWANSSGGVGNYSVAIKESFDTGYNPQKHLEGYTALKDDVAALSMSLGTVQTLFILDEMDADNMIAVPMSWWSGWSYKDKDKGLVIEFGSQYCADGMNAVDWSLANLGEIKTIGIMGFAGDYGSDWAAGVAKAAEANGLEVAWTYTPPATEFDVAQAVGLMVTQPVDAYYPAINAGFMAQVAGGAAQQGITPFAMLAGPSFNDAFVQEGFALKGLFESGAIYAMGLGAAPYEADTPGHAAMRATMSQITESANPFLVAGWSSQYHLLGVLEAAIKGGDISRAGIRRAAANVTVDSDGFFPSRTLGQDRADAQAYIAVPDGSIGSGQRLLAGGYVGPTAKAYDWTLGACS
jgi:ABC-type branched-subunit amino acid transport system substrate-binding protein